MRSHLGGDIEFTVTWKRCVTHCGNFQVPSWRQICHPQYGWLWCRRPCWKHQENATVNNQRVPSDAEKEDTDLVDINVISLYERRRVLKKGRAVLKQPPSTERGTATSGGVWRQRKLDQGAVPWNRWHWVTRKKAYQLLEFLSTTGLPKTVIEDSSGHLTNSKTVLNW